MSEVDLRVGDCLATLRAMSDSSVHSIVTDPPYGLGKEPDAREVLTAWLDGSEFKPGGAGFMGKSWDAFVPSPLVWAECLRVLKPGGHLVAFAGSRTYDWIVMGVRLAGFEVRDQLIYMYGSGFPKSMNVSKAIDRRRDDAEQICQVTTWIREARDSAGVTNREIDDAFGFSGMAGHWASAASQPAVPTLDQIPPLLDVLGVALDDVPSDIRELIWTLNGRKGQPGAAWFEREVIGTAKGATSIYTEQLKTMDQIHNVTASATDDARTWEGWGTACKPAHEPILLARKPLSGTVAANVLEHGTGAINVDGCRVKYESGGDSASNPMTRRARGCKTTSNTGGSRSIWGSGAARNEIGNPQGRWPANILHDGSPEVLAVFPETGAASASFRGDRAGVVTNFGGADTHRGHDDAGGSAARYFYSAKASRAERELGLADFAPVGDGERRNTHVCVKPVSVMRWLVRLVTPPGGTILDPYTGSGTTGIAAALEGFDFIGCELSPEYISIARARIAHAVEFPAMWEPDYQAPDEVPEEQLDLFGGQS